jgi:uncharacterized membrane protein
MAARPKIRLGSHIAPPRFILFVVLLIVAGAIGIGWLGWVHGTMAGFDFAALAFLLSCISLLDDCDAKVMRRRSEENDANRAGLLALTAAVTIVILVAVGAELAKKEGPSGPIIALVVGTLVLAWLFSNVVYALHYAHMFYKKDKGTGRDYGGIDIPGAKEPDYADFIYFSFTLGMTFQTSDTAIKSGRFRRVAIFHCFAAFVFNIGVLAFSINVLGGSH